MEYDDSGDELLDEEDPVDDEDDPVDDGGPARDSTEADDSRPALNSCK